jgi:surfeit locus 1 family protein
MLPTLAAVVLAGLFIALGMWQLNRAQEKQAMLAQYERLSQRRAVALRLPVAHPARWRHRKVSVTGHFERGRQFLLDNKISRGQVGYHVLTPLRLSASGRSVLVDRGWVPLGASREELPRIPVTGREVTVDGVVYVPFDEPYSLGGMDTGETGWPRRVQFIDFKQMARRLDAPLASMVVRLDPAAPYGYRREWELVPFSPERHLGYAVQWFALASAVLILYIVVNLRRKQ